MMRLTPRETHDEPTALRDLDVVDLDEVTQQYAIVIGRDAVEIAKCEHALGKLCRVSSPVLASVDIVWW